MTVYKVTRTYKDGTQIGDEINPTVIIRDGLTLAEAQAFVSGAVAVPSDAVSGLIETLDAWDDVISENTDPCPVLATDIAKAEAAAASGESE